MRLNGLAVSGGPMQQLPGGMVPQGMMGQMYPAGGAPMQAPTQQQQPQQPQPRPSKKVCDIHKIKHNTTAATQQKGA